MKFKIRKVTFKDSKIIYAMRQDLLTKKYNIKKNNFTLEEHNIWLKNKIRSKKSNFFLACKDDAKKTVIAYVRFDKESFYFKVSINISAKFRGKNLSYTILEQAEKKFKKDSLLLAEVNKHNLRSINLFKSLKYQIIDKKNDSFFYIKHLSNLLYKKNYNLIIDQIENARKGNNVNWMDILRIAFNNSSEETSLIFERITKSDEAINRLSKKLSK